MGMRAPDECGVQRAWQAHVIDELALPGQKRRVFEARDPCAELLRAHMPIGPAVAWPVQAGERVSAGRDGKERASRNPHKIA
jgi:hypothetical protein